MAITIKTNDPFAAYRKNAIPGANYVYVKPKTQSKTDITGTTLVSMGTPLTTTSGGSSGSTSSTRKTSSRSNPTPSAVSIQVPEPEIISTPAKTQEPTTKATQTQAQARAEVGLPNIQPVQAPLAARQQRPSMPTPGRIGIPTQQEMARARTASYAQAGQPRMNTLGSAGQFGGESSEFAHGGAIFDRINAVGTATNIFGASPVSYQPGIMTASKTTAQMEAQAAKETAKYAQSKNIFEMISTAALGGTAIGNFLGIKGKEAELSERALRAKYGNIFGGTLAFAAGGLSVYAGLIPDVTPRKPTLQERTGITGWPLQVPIRKEAEAAGRAPAFTGGVVAGNIALLAGPEKAIGKIPIKLRSAELPGGTYRGLSAEWGAGAKAQPLFGFVGRKASLGTPTIDIAKAAFSEYVPKSATATKITKSNILKAYGIEAPKFTSVVDVLEVTGRVKSRFNKGMFPEQTKTLSAAGTQEVLKFAKQNKATLYGSFTAEPQLKGTLGRVPGDIDVQLNANAARAEAITKDLTARLRATEGAGRVRVSAESPMLIETMGKGGEFHHAVDIHAYDLGNAVSEGAFGIKYGAKAKVAGQNVMALSEFGVRKGASSATLREMGISPASHRMKDILDFVPTQESQIASVRGGIFGKFRGGKAAKAERGLAEFRKAWGLDEKAMSKSVKMELYSPESVSRGNAQLLRSMGIIPSKGASVRASPSMSASATLRSMGIYPSPSPSRSISVSPSPFISSYGGVSPSTSRSLLKSYGIYSPSPGSPSPSRPSGGSRGPSSGSPSPSPISKSVSPSPRPSSPSSTSASRRLYPMMFSGASMAGKAKPGYDAYVKVRVNPRSGLGKARKINKEPLGFYGAVSAGASFVDNTPAGSFTVRKAKQAAKSQGIDLWHGGLDRKFRARKLKTTFTAAEKTKYLMDSQGEKRYYKGAAKQGKKKSKLRRKGIDIRSVI